MIAVNHTWLITEFTTYTMQNDTDVDTYLFFHIMVTICAYSYRGIRISDVGRIKVISARPAFDVDRITIGLSSNAMLRYAFDVDRITICLSSNAMLRYAALYCV